MVASCSYEARKYGVHSAMPSRMAKLLRPQAIFVRGNMDQYSKASLEITDILRERVPLIEKASIDEHYIDMTGMDRFHGVMKYAHELRSQVIKETGLPISFGLSVNKTVSKMANNECKPNGELNIEQPKGNRLFTSYSAVHPLSGNYGVLLWISTYSQRKDRY
ncbi:hypothetical protein [Pedobacter sp. FW305-3-2-15-E-R2A2]|uniref:Y-family DNA polymerase n=1 Tax=Pedobacter sp. FW305-3-2-15-E-R2A2 TaxID=3140251 RepID=UPI0031406FB9